MGGRLVDVCDVERIAVQRTYRGSLVDVDVFDPQLLADLEVPVRPRVVQLVPTRIALPLRGVQLHPLELEPLGVAPQLAVPYVEFVSSRRAS